MKEESKIVTGIKSYDEVLGDARFYEKEADRLRAENQMMREALEVARKHISGNAEKFSERERTPVLFQINEALGE